jgi:AmiR/NasT family two-component response regulator
MDCARRVKPILDTCISRFNAFSRCADELDQTRRALEERKIIDRAKGILMKERRLSEEQAMLLRKAAMDQNEDRRRGQQRGHRGAVPWRGPAAGVAA